MRRSDLVARLDEIQRVGRETGEVEAALAAAVIAQAIHDARYGIAGTASDPEEARAWLRSTGRRWLDLMRPPAGGGSRLSAVRIA